MNATSYDEWLNEQRRAEEQSRRDMIAAYYAANPRVLTAERRVTRALATKSALEMQVAYARTGRRSDLADRLMGLTGVPTPDLERAYARAAHDHAAAWLRVKELR